MERLYVSIFFTSPVSIFRNHQLIFFQCVVGSIAGLYSPANMISYASTKSFINTFSTSLRVLAAPFGVDVVTVQPGFIDTRMTKMMRGQASSVLGSEFASAEGMAKEMKRAVEEGGVGVVCWPSRQGIQMYALRGEISLFIECVYAFGTLLILLLFYF